MNISPVSNYNNTSFGMAFKKPSPEVTNLFRETISSMSPKERTNFVNTVGQIVEQSKSCPIEIEHTISKDYTPHYAAKVGNNVYTYNAQKSTNRADSILETMKKAVLVAENEHNININMSKLIKILNS